MDVDARAFRYRASRDGKFAEKQRLFAWFAAPRGVAVRRERRSVTPCSDTALGPRRAMQAVDSSASDSQRRTASIHRVAGSSHPLRLREVLARGRGAARKTPRNSAKRWRRRKGILAGGKPPCPQERDAFVPTWVEVHTGAPAPPYAAPLPGARRRALTLTPGTARSVLSIRSVPHAATRGSVV